MKCILNHENAFVVIKKSFFKYFAVGIFVLIIKLDLFFVFFFF